MTTPPWQLRSGIGTPIPIPYEPSASRFPTVRDHFAMAALTGLLANPNIEHRSFDEMATEAYQWADAMMKARAQ